MSESMPEAAAPVHRMIVVGDGTYPSWDNKEQVLTPLSRQRLAAVGGWYQSEGFDEAVVIALGDNSDTTSDTSNATGFMQKQLKAMYGVPDEAVVPVDAAGTPFQVFASIIRKKIFTGQDFTPDYPLLLVTSRSYGRFVMAPIARRAFGITDEEALRIVPSERARLRDYVGYDAATIAVKAAMAWARVEPCDLSSLRQASKYYSQIRKAEKTPHLRLNEPR